MPKLPSIIEGCIRQDPGYQKILYNQFKGFSLKIVFRYIYQYDKAVDVMHDGFVKLFKNVHQFQLDVENTERQFMAYLKRIMIHAAIDELRKTDLLPEIGGIPEYVWDLSDKSHGADQLILYKELIRVIKSLPPQYRTVFQLYIIDGYNHIEISEMLGIAIGTSKSILYRARSFVQKKISKWEEAAQCRI